MKTRNRLEAILAGLALAAAASSAFGADPVGRVLLSAGEVFAVRDGKPVRLSFNSPIEFKDVLRTGPASSLQVRFVDESLVSVRENSEFAIEEYQFGAKPEEQRSFFNLLKGGFRSVTGLIGRANNANYRVRTSTSTIGIRGTDYAVRDCRGDCGAGVKDGLYGTVLGLSSGTNKITVTNNAGEQTFATNQHFYVADVNARPQPLLQPPSFVSVKPQGKAEAAQQGGSGTGGEAAGGSSGAQGESRPSASSDAVVSSPIVVQPFQVTEVLTSAGTSAALPPANGFIVAYPYGSSADVTFDNDKIFGSYNSQNQLLSYGTTGTFPYGSLGSGTITDTGSTTLASGQTFVWGRWTGSTSVVSATGATLSNVPLLFGTATGLQTHTSTTNLVGKADYAFAGGPRPVDAAGNVGSVTGSSLTIDFTARTAKYFVDLLFSTVGSSGSAAFAMSGTGGATTGGNNGEFGGSLTGSCSGGGCLTSTASGQFKVGLTGTVGYEFGVVGGSVSGTQAGSVVFLNAYNATSFTPGTGLVGQIAFSSSSPATANTATISTVQGLTLSGSNLFSFGNGSSFPSGNLAGGSVAETGNTSLVDGSTMIWGRWIGSTQVVTPTVGTISPASGLPYVLGTSGNVPASGSFVYSLAGGPAAVSANGTVGTALTGGAFDIAFGTTPVIRVASPLTLAVGGVSYSLGSCASGCTLSNSTGIASGMNLSGTCVGGACSTSAGATANSAGVLVGANGAGFAVAGNILSPEPTVTFAGAFKR